MGLQGSPFSLRVPQLCLFSSWKCLPLTLGPVLSSEEAPVLQIDRYGVQFRWTLKLRKVLEVWLD